MMNFLKMIAIFAVLGIVSIASLFVLDVVTGTEMKELLTKVILVLGILAFGGLAVSFLVRPHSS